MSLTRRKEAMPLYTYRCENGHQFDRILRLKDYLSKQICDCGAETKKLILPTMINCDIAPWDRYISPVSGKPITSYRERREDMKKHDCVDYEPSLKGHITKHMHDEDAKLERAMDETVEREVESMPVRKREKLAEELTSGADCEYTRI